MPRLTTTTINTAPPTDQEQTALIGKKGKKTGKEGKGGKEKEKRKKGGTGKDPTALSFTIDHGMP